MITEPTRRALRHQCERMLTALRLYTISEVEYEKQIRDAQRAIAAMLRPGTEVQP